jgi:hypothetical protein
MASILCYHCHSKHQSVADVKVCAAAMNDLVGTSFAAKVETGKIVETVKVPAHRTSAAYLALKAKQTPRSRRSTSRLPSTMRRSRLSRRARTWSRGCTRSRTSTASR